MENNPVDVRFSDLYRVCEYYFNEGRRGKGGHFIFKTLWVGNPRINIQNDNGKAKAYQVRQVIKAIKRLEAEYGDRGRKKK
jgi:hypothetical protein